MIDVGWWSRADAARRAWSARAATCAVLVYAASLLGCGDDATMPPPVADGGTIAYSGFDPDASALPGEGDACRFTLQCGERQICVDDRCVRYERIAPEELEQGELRTMTPAELAASPLIAGAPGPWPAGPIPGEVGSVYPFAYVAAGRDGAQLVMFLRRQDSAAPDTCQVARIGERVVVVRIEGFVCDTANASEEGELAIAGIVTTTAAHNDVPLDLRRFAPDGAPLGVLQVDPSVLAAARAEQGEAPISNATSLLYDRDDVIASIRITPWGETGGGGPAPTFGLTYLRVTSTGASVIPIGGAQTIEGDRGWLVHEGTRVRSIVRVNPDLPSTLVAVDLADGSRSTVVEDEGALAVYAQHSAAAWSLSTATRCGWESRTSDGHALSIPMGSCWSDFWRPLLITESPAPFRCDQPFDLTLSRFVGSPDGTPKVLDAAGAVVGEISADAGMPVGISRFDRTLEGAVITHTLTGWFEMALHRRTR